MFIRWLLSPASVFFLLVGFGLAFRWYGVSQLPADDPLTEYAWASMIMRLSNVLFVTATFLVVLRWLRRWAGIHWDAWKAKIFNENPALYVSVTYAAVVYLVVEAWKMQA